MKQFITNEVWTNMRCYAFHTFGNPAQADWLHSQPGSCRLVPASCTGLLESRGLQHWWRDPLPSGTCPETSCQDVKLSPVVENTGRFSDEIISLKKTELSEINSEAKHWMSKTNRIAVNHFWFVFYAPPGCYVTSAFLHEVQCINERETKWDCT